MDIDIDAVGEVQGSFGDKERRLRMTISEREN